MTHSTSSALSDHYLNLPGARLVATSATRLTLRHLKFALAARAMMCVHGGVGLGKTVAVRTNLRDLAPDATVHLQLRPQAPLGELHTTLAQKLGLPPDADPTTALPQALATQPRILFLDEAQGLTNQALEYVRYLWDAESTQLAVVFVGGENCHRRLRSRAALASRIGAWQQYRPLTPDEVLTHMPTYHAVWKDVSTTDLLWLDDVCCHGNFRHWAKVTYHLHHALQDDQLTDKTVTRDLLWEILQDVDSTVRPEHRHGAGTDRQ
ncbi:AAA family ATPase [Streptomyces chrestomyceticus]|uniref:AAA family ATPase n=1 Tax=Streptomyces chrestomyceticus TaxID=68185 RepID=UPI00367687FF